MKENKILKNPILPGFYPDPSICRVEDDFYLITSSFSMFPGVPIFHSTDLAHWEQIGNILERKSQLHLTPDSLVAGIMAPTLRYHNGTFYMITTNVSDRWNFIVTAQDPKGPWSEPYWLEGAEGIDPSLFFDEDGKTYFTGTRQKKKDDGTSMGQEIWISEFDVDSMCLKGPRIGLWQGSLVNAASPEAPHLYKKNGYYYLMIAEGGTEHFHAVTIARSRKVFGPYEGYAGNPIMTHRQLGKMYPICNVGHADLIELKNGEWYAVMLASRLIDGYHKNLGRETFCAPVEWEEDWPVISPGSGKLEWSYTAPELPDFKPSTIPGREEFNDDRLGMQWILLGTPYQDFYSLKDSKLTMKLLARPMCQELKPLNHEPDPNLYRKGQLSAEELGQCYPGLGFIGLRQRHENFSMTVKMTFHADTDNETAGLAVVQASNHQFRLERSMESGKQMIRLVQCTCEMKGFPWMPGFESKTTELTLAKTEIDCTDIILKITASGQSHSFYYGASENRLKPLLEHADGGMINPEIVGGMVGTLLGMFGSSKGMSSENYVEFDWAEYIGE